MLCISTSGALGRYIRLAPPLTIFYRSVIGFLFLFFILLIRGKKLKRSTFVSHHILISSLLMAAHWITYFYALRFSNVAIGMLSLFTYPIFTALLEPFFIKSSRLDVIHVFFGFLLLLGIFFLVPSLSIEDNITKGVLFGLISSICYSIRNILLKIKIVEEDAVSLMAVQTIIISIILLPGIFIYKHEHLETDWWAILTLGIVTTAIGHSLFVRSFKHVSISKVSIISSLQPLFGIFIAYLFLREVPEIRTFIGGGVIILLVLLETARDHR